MKKSIKLQIWVLASLGLAGCHLEQAPDCLMGQKTCRNDAVLNQGILQVCMENNTWQEIACLGACVDKKSCGENEVIFPCTENSEEKCVSTDKGSFSFVCIEHQWIPSVCGSKAQCDGNVCLASDTQCEEGARMCNYIDVMERSVSSVCREGHWISNFCKENQWCDGDVCGVIEEEDIHECGTPAVDCEQSVTGWSKGYCHAGQCEAIRCIDGYALKDGDCKPNNECCGTECVNCLTNGKICSSQGVCEKTSEITTSEGCPTGQVICSVSDICIDFRYDPFNCGGCDNKCLATQLCNMGNCEDIEPTCGDGTYYSEQTISIVDPETDVTETKTVNAYCINSELQMKNLKAANNPDTSDYRYVFPVNNSDKAYILMNDLTLTQDSFGIGSNSTMNAFNGIFLGNDKTITGDSLVAGEFNSGSLYGCGGGLFNTVINAVFIGGTYKFTMAIDDTADNCYYSIGGLAGDVMESYIDNVKVDVSIIGNSKQELHITEKEVDSIGGLAGFISDSIVENSEVLNFVFSDSTEKRKQYIGGFTGQISSVKIRQSNANSVNIHGVYNNIVGGFVGYAYDSYESTLSDCHVNPTSTGKCSLIAYANAGGFVGHVNSKTFESCSANCEISCDYTRCGGFVGFIFNGEFSKCAAYGNIAGSADTVGGFAGMASYGKISNSYYLGNVCSGELYSKTGGLIGYIDKEEQLFNTYALTTIKDGMNGAYVYKNKGADLSNKNFYYQLACAGQECSQGVYDGDENGLASFSINSSNVPMVGSDTLLSKLGSEYSEATCTFDFGEGKKTYKLPVIESVKPSFCE